MAEPTLVLSLQDYIIRVAEYLAIADYSGGSAGVPTDAHDLDVCTRIANDGWRKFVNSNARWNWMEPITTLTLVPATLGTMQSVTTGNPVTFTDSARNEGTNAWANATMTITSGSGSGATAFTVTSNTSGGVFTLTATSWPNGTPDNTSQYKLVPQNSQLVDPADNNRYYMPDGFIGQIIGFWTYPVVGPRLKIQNTHENHIRQLFAASGGVTGNPWLAAFRPLSTQPGAYANRWEVIFYPVPLQSYVITSRIRIYPNKLVNLTDRQNAGIQYDECVLAAIMAMAELERNDKAGPRASDFADALQRAIEYDRHATPNRLGYNGDRSDDAYGPGRRPLNYYSVDSYNGNPV